MPLKRDVQPGDRLVIGDTVIEVEFKSGQRTRLSIESAQEVQHQKAGAKPSLASRPEPAPPAQPAPAPAQDNTPRPRLRLA